MKPTSWKKQEITNRVANAAATHGIARTVTKKKNLPYRKEEKKNGQKKQTNQITAMEKAFAQILAKSILEEGEAKQ